MLPPHKTPFELRESIDGDTYGFCESEQSLARPVHSLDSAVGERRCPESPQVLSCSPASDKVIILYPVDIRTSVCPCDIDYGNTECCISVGVLTGLDSCYDGVAPIFTGEPERTQASSRTAEGPSPFPLRVLNDATCYLGIERIVEL